MPIFNTVVHAITVRCPPRSQVCYLILAHCVYIQAPKAPKNPAAEPKNRPPKKISKKNRLYPKYHASHNGGITVAPYTGSNTVEKSLFGRLSNLKKCTGFYQGAQL